MRYDFIRISKDLFFDYFQEDRYAWVYWTSDGKKGLPEPPYWQAHLDWVFDTITQTYVGYRASSSWNPYVEYTILGELASAEMKEWNARLLVVQKWRRDKADREIWNNPEYWAKKLKFDPTATGLFEYLDDGNAIEYDPSNFSIDYLTKVFDDILQGREDNKNNDILM